MSESQGKDGRTACPSVERDRACARRSPQNRMIDGFDNPIMQRDVNPRERMRDRPDSEVDEEVI
ncbi:hypothetical protein SPHINGOR109_10550 [Sphingorhabdus sp. 109]|nr:hypothetical protein SPHINGOR109_10550 [Sphingorhabdus sp. 109]